jgi:heat shock protein HslJ
MTQLRHPPKLPHDRRAIPGKIVQTALMRTVPVSLPSTRLALFVLAAAIGLAGCGHTAGETTSGTAGLPDVLANLTANEWTLKTGSSTPAIQSASPVTIRFTTGHMVSGAAPCNAYHGRFTLHGDAIMIGPLAQTLKACIPAAETAEHAYLTALERVTTVKNSSRDTLDLTGGSHIHLVYAAGGPA